MFPIEQQCSRHESEIRGTVSVGKDLKYFLIPSPLPWAVAPFTRPHFAGLHPGWPYRIRDGASTISLGNSSASPPSWKRFLSPISNLSLHSLNLKPFPLVLLLHGLVNSIALSFL